MDQPVFGLGAYTLPEAARLSGLKASNLRRWLFGYSYDHHGPKVSQPPLWRLQYATDLDEPILGFRDLIEARIVGQLRELGMGLPTIRACLLTAAEVANDAHPFSSAGFKTDGRRLFLERVDALGQKNVIDLKTRQHAFAKVIERSFLDLEFDDQKATRWFLLAKKQTVVADPERSFGAPIMTESGVPTSAIARAVAAEGSPRKVARIFEVAISAVRDALKFEQQLKVYATA